MWAADCLYDVPSGIVEDLVFLWGRFGAASVPGLMLNLNKNRIYLQIIFIGPAQLGKFSLWDKPRIDVIVIIYHMTTPIRDGG